jgi:hypothetical protein
LERLLADCKNPPACFVAFTRPEGVSKEWTDGVLWRSAAAIPGAALFRDDSGAEARLFGAETSGHAVLYNAEGTLTFQGGMTASRGHEGDNPGRSALRSLLNGATGASVRAPVFGCPLLDRCEK